MGDSDKYLNELKEIKRKNDFRTVREAYDKQGGDGFRDSAKASSLSNTGNFYLDQGRGKFHRFYESDRVTISSTAYHLMQSDKPANIILGALIYERMGKGKKVMPRMMKALEKSSKKHEISKDTYDKFQKFIERNSGEEQSRGTGLEGRAGVFILSILGGIALGFASLQSTGNVIGNLTGTSQGLLGILLFIVGLVGMFFHLKR